MRCVCLSTVYVYIDIPIIIMKNLFNEHQKNYLNLNGLIYLITTMARRRKWVAKCKLIIESENFIQAHYNILERKLS